VFEATNSARLAPRASRVVFEITTAIRATDVCYRTVTDEHPRCVRLPAASRACAHVHRSILRLIFADESRVFTTPDPLRRPQLTQRWTFARWQRSSYVLSSIRGDEGETSLTLLSPHLLRSPRFPESECSGSAKTTMCFAPREKVQRVCDPKRLPSIKPSAPMHLRTSGGT